MKETLRKKMAYECLKLQNRIDQLQKQEEEYAEAKNWERANDRKIRIETFKIVLSSIKEAMS